MSLRICYACDNKKILSHRCITPWIHINKYLPLMVFSGSKTLDLENALKLVSL